MYGNPHIIYSCLMGTISCSSPERPNLNVFDVRPFWFLVKRSAVCASVKLAIFRKQPLVNIFTTSCFRNFHSGINVTFLCNIEWAVLVVLDCKPFSWASYFRLLRIYDPFQRGDLVKSAGRGRSPSFSHGLWHFADPLHSGGGRRASWGEAGWRKVQWPEWLD